MTGQNIVSDIFSFEFQLELILRLIFACLAGALVGFERKKRLKAAGMRTHIMVALASALFAICSKYGYFDVIQYSGVDFDASRIGAGIVAGVAFLGAGSIIIKSKSIRGLTTAAGVWTIAGIGLCFGSGMYVIAAAATLLIIVMQYFMHNVLLRIEGLSVREVTISIDNSENVIEDFISELKKIDSSLSFTSIAKKEDNIIVMKVNVRAEDTVLTDDIWSFMKRYPYVISSSL